MVPKVYLGVLSVLAAWCCGTNEWVVEEGPDEMGKGNVCMKLRERGRLQLTTAAAEKAELNAKGTGGWPLFCLNGYSNWVDQLARLVEQINLSYWLSESSNYVTAFLRVNKKSENVFLSQPHQHVRGECICEYPNIEYENWTTNKRNFEGSKGLELVWTHACLPGKWEHPVLWQWPYYTDRQWVSILYCDLTIYGHCCTLLSVACSTAAFLCNQNLM